MNSVLLFMICITSGLVCFWFFKKCIDWFENI